MIQASSSVILMANKGNLKARALSKWNLKKQREKSPGEAYVRCSSKASEKYQSNTDQR